MPFVKITTSAMKMTMMTTPTRSCEVRCFEVMRKVPFVESDENFSIFFYSYSASRVSGGEEKCRYIIISRMGSRGKMR